MNPFYFYLANNPPLGKNHAKTDWCLCRGCAGEKAATHADWSDSLLFGKACWSEPTAMLWLINQTPWVERPGADQRRLIGEFKLSKPKTTSRYNFLCDRTFIKLFDLNPLFLQQHLCRLLMDVLDLHILVRHTFWVYVTNFKCLIMHTSLNLYCTPSKWCWMVNLTSPRPINLEMVTIDYITFNGIPRDIRMSEQTPRLVVYLQSVMDWDINPSWELDTIPGHHHPIQRKPPI